MSFDPCGIKSMKFSVRMTKKTSRMKIATDDRPSPIEGAVSHRPF